MWLDPFSSLTRIESSDFIGWPSANLTWLEPPANARTSR